MRTTERQRRSGQRRPAWPGNARNKLLVAGVAALFVAGACGTRLPEEAFTHGGSAQGSRTGRLASGEGSGEFVDGTETGGGGLTTEPGGGGRASPGGGSGRGGGGSAVGPGTRSGDGSQGGPGGGGGGGPAGENFASDVGVTADTITIGTITARTGVLGDEAFAGPLEGARAFFLALNAKGGVNGRQIRFVTCDDKENPDVNRSCARKLIDNDKVFALTANATRSYAGAPFVNERGVPDVGSIPIANAYYKFPMLFSLYGTQGLPRDGKQIGVGGKVYNSTTSFRWFKEKLNIKKAAVIFYDESISRTAGTFIADGLRREGIEVVYTPNGGRGRNLADPNWDTEVINMRQNGAEALWHAIDIAGFQKLCESMDRFDFTVKAAVATIAAWSDTVGKDFSSPCRNSVYAVGSAVPYSNRSHPGIADFRAAMEKFSPPGFALRQWAVDGWVGAKLLTDGIAKMGANVTRKGLVDWLNGLDGSYDAGGLIAPETLWWQTLEPSYFDQPAKECNSVAKWDDRAGTFVAQTGAGFFCGGQWYPYEPVPDGTT